MLFRVTTGWLLIFLPYVHPNIHHFSMFYIKKKLFGDFAPMPSPGYHPGPPGPLRPPAAIILASSKINVPIFFSVLSPVYCYKTNTKSKLTWSKLLYLLAAFPWQADQYRRFHDSCKCHLLILSFFFSFAFF